MNYLSNIGDRLLWNGNNIILISSANNAIKHMIKLSRSITLLARNNKDFSSNLGKNLTLGPFYLFISGMNQISWTILHHLWKYTIAHFEFPIRRKRECLTKIMGHCPHWKESRIPISSGLIPLPHLLLANENFFKVC